MSFLLVTPETLGSASAAIAAVFGAQAKQYQAAAALAATYHEQFARALSAAAASYAGTETHGLPIAAMPIPGSTNPDGLAFYQGFHNALETMYDSALANPIVAADGHITDVAYSSELAIEVGTLMSVNNPEPLLMLTHPLPNTGVVVIDGSAGGGWTMESWDGTPVPPASLPTSLFVDVRNLISAPQFASYHILQAALTGNPATIVNAIRYGVVEVGTATIEFPFAVAQSLIDAVIGS